MLSILVIVIALKICWNKNLKLFHPNIFYNNIYIFFAYSIVTSVTPFLQPRYYLPLLLSSINKTTLKTFISLFKGNVLRNSVTYIFAIIVVLNTPSNAYSNDTYRQLNLFGDVFDASGDLQQLN